MNINRHNFSRRAKRFVVNNLPIPIVNRRLDKALLRQEFKDEFQLIDKSSTNTNTNTHPSIIHFSINKAATQYVQGVLKEAVGEVGMKHINLPGIGFRTDMPYLDQITAQEMQQYQYLFRDTGYLYSVFGGMVENIPHLEKFKIVLFIRDPRDILVSDYFSTAHSHVLPSKYSNKRGEFKEKRRITLQQSIDDYAIQECDTFSHVFERYIEHLISSEQPYHLTRYEDMILDFDGWLYELVDYCEIELSDTARQTLINNHSKRKPKGENKHKHYRKGKSGDYLEKLKPATIDYINSKFEPYLKEFGYQ